MRAWSSLGAADRLALAVLVTIPIVMGLPPSLLGRPLLAGDNLTQNYPLRVLAGAFLRQGHLPLWDAWMWSGTPLLAGWNAGAMYPGTWLFAVLPPVAAWTVNYLAVGIVLATGTYVFLRRQRTGPLAAFLGAAVFSFAGFMAAQMLHIGLVTGLSFLPWMLVAVDGMARREGGPGGGWTLLLGVCGGLLVLAGDPRAITDVAEIVAAFAIAVAWRRRGRALSLLVGILAGVALAVGLGAVQWLPGVHFIAASQRGQSSYRFYGNLSLTAANMPLVVFPYLLGGYGDLGTHGYVGPYNLPEVTWSLGILPLVATFALVSRRLRSPGGRPLGVWYALVLLGVLTALGSSTPLGHLFARVPLFGAERLQARNILLADFGMAVLFAVWVEEALAPDGAPLQGAPRRRGLVPVVAAMALVVVAEIFERSTAQALGVPASLAAGAIRTMTPYLAPATAIAAAAGVLLLVGRRLSPARRRLLLTAIAVVDLAFFTVNESIVPADPSFIARSNPLSARIAVLTGPQGRYATYNPVQEPSDPSNATLFQIGSYDLSILHRELQVTGYGSVVDATYQQETATHWVETLRTSSLRSGLFEDLDLRAILTLPSYLATPLPRGAGPPRPSPGPPQAGLPGDTPTNAALAPPVGRLPLRAGGRRSYVLPGPVDVTAVTVEVGGGAGARLRVGLAGASGRPRWLGEAAGGTGPTTLAATGGAGSLDVVLAAAAGAPAVVDTVEVATSSGQRLLLDGALQGSLEAPRWHYAGTVGPWLAFLDAGTRGLSWVVPRDAPEPSVASVPGSDAATAVAWPEGPDTTTVSTPAPALLVRSVPYAPGWRAVVEQPDGTTTTVPVRRIGPVQAVPVPAGRTTVHWIYASAAATAGAWISAATALLALCAGIAVIWRGRRRTGSPRRLLVRRRFASIS